MFIGHFLGHSFVQSLSADWLKDDGCHLGHYAQWFFFTIGFSVVAGSITMPIAQHCGRNQIETTVANRDGGIRICYTTRFLLIWPHIKHLFCIQAQAFASKKYIGYQLVTHNRSQKPLANSLVIARNFHDFASDHRELFPFVILEIPARFAFKDFLMRFPIILL